MILDLRIPKSAQYQGVVLDTAAQFLAGELTPRPDDAADRAGLEKITDEEERDKQKEAYASSLNIQR